MYGKRIPSSLSSRSQTEPPKRPRNGEVPVEESSADPHTPFHEPRRSPSPQPESSRSTFRGHAVSVPRTDAYTLYDPSQSRLLQVLTPRMHQPDYHDQPISTHWQSRYPQSSVFPTSSVGVRIAQAAVAARQLPNSRFIPIATVASRAEKPAVKAVRVDVSRIPKHTKRVDTVIFRSASDAIPPQSEALSTISGRQDNRVQRGEASLNCASITTVGEISEFALQAKDSSSNEEDPDIAPAAARVEDEQSDEDIRKAILDDAERRRSTHLVTQKLTMFDLNEYVKQQRYPNIPYLLASERIGLKSGVPDDIIFWSREDAPAAPGTTPLTPPNVLLINQRNSWGLSAPILDIGQPVTTSSSSLLYKNVLSRPVNIFADYGTCPEQNADIDYLGRYVIHTIGKVLSQQEWALNVPKDNKKVLARLVLGAQATENEIAAAMAQFNLGARRLSRYLLEFDSYDDGCYQKLMRKPGVSLPGDTAQTYEVE